MEEVNKNTELDNTDKKLHISDVISSLKLTNKQKNCIANIIEKVMDKYDKKAISAENRRDDKSLQYNSGVVDGLNNAYKIIMGIDDDYLDGVNF